MPGSDGERDVQPAIVLRHYGGETRTVPVLSAESGFKLRVQWGGGAGVYVVNLKPTVHFPSGVLEKTRGFWTPVDREAGLRLWYRLVAPADRPTIKRVTPKWTTLTKGKRAANE